MAAMAKERTQASKSLNPSPDKHKTETPRQPLKSTGALEQYEYFDVTPIIGREFPKADIVEWLQASNSDELLRELALTSTLLPRLTTMHSTLLTKQARTSLPTRCRLLPRPRKPHAGSPKTANPKYWAPLRETLRLRVAHQPSSQPRTRDVQDQGLADQHYRQRAR